MPKLSEEGLKKKLLKEIVESLKHLEAAKKKLLDGAIKILNNTLTP